MAVLNYLDALAQELTNGTKLPFSFARETLKMLALAALGKDAKLSLPWFPNIHRRQYVILVSDTPGAGKGETFRRCQQTVLRSAEEGKPWKLEFISGDSLGSPQWACVALGGDRSKEPVKLSGNGKSGITVKLSTDPNGRIVYYDEGRRLMQQDAVGKTERGLITMFTSLFESNQHSMGSFAHGSAFVRDANVSLMMHFTQAGFDSTFTGSGATTDGFPSRCTLIVEDAVPFKQTWRVVSSQRVRELVGKILECEPRDWASDSAIDDARAKLWAELAEANPLHTARLQFLFSQDLLARAIFSERGLCLEAALASAEWTRRQLRARALTWPLDQSGDRNERIHLALVQAFRKKPVLSLKEIKDAINYYRLAAAGRAL